MIKEFHISTIFNESLCLGGKSNGLSLRRNLETALNNGKVYIDFEGLPLITQGFSDEFLGPLLTAKGKTVLNSIIFRNCSQDVQAILTSTVRRFSASA